MDSNGHWGRKTEMSTSEPSDGVDCLNCIVYAVAENISYLSIVDPFTKKKKHCKSKFVSLINLT